MIDTSIVTLEKAIDINYIVSCTDSELIKLMSIANIIYDLTKHELINRNEN
jgi:aconitase A